MRLEKQSADTQKQDRGKDNFSFRHRHSPFIDVLRLDMPVTLCFPKHHPLSLKVFLRAAPVNVRDENSLFDGTSVAENGLVCQNAECQTYGG